MQAWIAVGVGASVGAWIRWGLSSLFNRADQPLAVGTLLANLIGGLFMGMVLAWLQQRSDISPTIRLLLTTGLLGGLTTFSAFSGESFALLMRQQYGWAVLHSALYVLGALLMTALGFYLVHSAKS